MAKANRLGSKKKSVKGLDTVEASNITVESTSAAPREPRKKQIAVLLTAEAKKLFKRHVNEEDTTMNAFAFEAIQEKLERMGYERLPD